MQGKEGSYGIRCYRRGEERGGKGEGLAHRNEVCACHHKKHSLDF